MNIKSTIQAAALLVAAALTTSFGACSAADATAPSDHGQTDVCKLDTKYLPRSPDAVEGWLRDCPS